MLNLSLVKWHAQKLHELLEQEPNNPILAKLCVELEATILNSSPFKDIEAAAPPDR